MCLCERDLKPTTHKAGKAIAEHMKGKHCVSQSEKTDKHVMLCGKQSHNYSPHRLGIVRSGLESNLSEFICLKKENGSVRIKNVFIQNYIISQ